KSGAGGLEVSKSDLLGDLGDQLSAAKEQAAKDAFSFGVEYGGGDATPHALGLALTADFYAELGGGHEFDELGRAERDFALGLNAWGDAFVVGAGAASPRCLHHQIANLVGSLDGSGAILRGATVDGPGAPGDFEGLGRDDAMRRCPASGGDAFARFSTKHARFLDASYAWPSVEPAIDYTALTVLYFARHADD
ncbi:MAG TPA: glycoside hydrolase family 9 protein, partial [Minicystis sp.]|nr:glycoside hydrolase family 9 protein [Minicystis sp.]